MWYLPETTYSAFGERTDLMSRLLVTAVSIFAVASLSGCASLIPVNPVLRSMEDEDPVLLEHPARSWRVV